jgi:hypothetical protein
MNRNIPLQDLNARETSQAVDRDRLPADNVCGWKSGG